MDAYKPLGTGDLKTELDNMQKASARPGALVGMQYRTIAPQKPQNGLYLADGTGWDPGSGRGLYRYDSDAGTYTFIG
jgi:hypothetical protein